MDLRKTTISAALVLGAVIVIPALAQNDDESAASPQTTGTTGTGVLDDETVSSMSASSRSQSSAHSSVSSMPEVEAEEDEDTETGDTVPRELPETGGGWGSDRQ